MDSASTIRFCGHGVSATNRGNTHVSDVKIQMEYKRQNIMGGGGTCQEWICLKLWAMLNLGCI